MQLKQFVLSEYCSKCDICCRFLDEETPLAPVFLDTETKLISYKDRFICPNFDPAKNNCKDYKNRPLDCQLYPFVVMWNKDYKNVVLGIDHKCPYITNYELRFTNYVKYLKSTLKDIDPRYIARFQADVNILGKLDINIPKGPVLNRLLISDKPLFERYGRDAKNTLSNYLFISNYIWTGLLNYSWIIIDDNFCLFCQSQNSIFMPIPPRTPPGCAFDKEVIIECFKTMDRLNNNKNSSRIEDISEKDLNFFSDLGYQIKEKGCEYLYKQKDLANLSGDKYKDKRALCNYFTKNYKFEYREFSARSGSAIDSKWWGLGGGKGNKRDKEGDEKGCLELFKRWKDQRLKVYKDTYYRALLEDSYFAHKKAMDRFDDLSLFGRVVIIDDRICAYTFGYPLNKNTFVILFEVADLKIKGLSQFIFRQFCRELDRFEYINAMDDSGLENLRKVKLSYHPFNIERTYCAYA